MKHLDYYERKLMDSKKSMFGCCFSIIGATILIVILLLFSGCKTVKKSVSEKENISDSVRIEYKEKIVKVPVTVEIEVPVENVANITKDSTSHLETSFAVSNASMVWIDGVPFLRHDLKNKAQKIEKTDTAHVVEKEKGVWNTRRVTYTKTEIREKQLAWYQKSLIWIGFISIIVILILVSFKALRR